MKILAIESGFLPELTSARLPFEFSSELKRRKHDVTVVAPFPRLHLVAEGGLNPDWKFFKWEQIKGVSVLRVIPQLKSKSLLSRAFENVLLPITLIIGGLVAGKKDVIHCQSPPFLLSLTSCFLSKLLRCPLVLRIQDVHPDALVKMGLIKNRIVIKLLEIIELFVYCCADQITVIAEGYKKHVISKGIIPSKVFLIPNWSSVSTVKHSDNNFRKENDLVGKFIITYAGTMSWPQDLATIIETANLLKNHKEIIFLLIGDGVQKEALVNRTKELNLKNVIFMPLQERKKYFHAINESDICVVPLKKSYTSPTAPSKMLDIMGCAKPILANVPAHSEVSRLIKQAKCGIDIEPENPEVFKKAILELHSDKGYREELGANGKTFVNGWLSLKSAIDRYEQLFLNFTMANCDCNKYLFSKIA
ncbi:MAG: glycosyltransferase WbuB [Dehalococcoidia bacterium]|nr:MAG: glycosyltransferase WbuB [Dehalococcoidia bacterium]